jgi:hypothetical protein
VLTSHVSQFRDDGFDLETTGRPWQKLITVTFTIAQGSGVTDLCRRRVLEHRTFQMQLASKFILFNRSKCRAYWNIAYISTILVFWAATRCRLLDINIPTEPAASVFRVAETLFSSLKTEERDSFLRENALSVTVQGNVPFYFETQRKYTRQVKCSVSDRQCNCYMHIQV